MNRFSDSSGEFGIGKFPPRAVGRRLRRTRALTNRIIMRPSRMTSSTGTTDLGIEPGFSGGILVPFLLSVTVPITTVLTSITLKLENTSLIIGTVPLLVDS
jgi:hypothetical protein